MPNPLQRLLDGFESFRQQYFERRPALFGELVQAGQRPKVLVIACSDSRVDPAILTRAKPGDIFIVRNVAALVPPYEPDGCRHGTSSAIEFAVRGLQVEHIVVLGHEMCGGIGALAAPESRPFEFMSDWVAVAAEARDEVARTSLEGDTRQMVLEQASLLCSVRNLMTFPWIRERVETGRLVLHAWYFGLRAGELLAFDPGAGQFAVVRGQARPMGERAAPGESGCGGARLNIRDFVQAAAGAAKE